MTDELDRISLTLPSSMADHLDDIVDDWEYDSRSEAIRDSLRDFFTTYQWESGDQAHYYGTIVISYEHQIAGIADDLQSVQHEMAGIITSVQHIHLSHDACMETLIVDGMGQEITELANRLRSLTGVQHVKVMIVTSQY